MKWPCDSDNPGVFLGSAALAAALLVGVLFFVGKLMVDQTEEPAGEYVSGEAIEEEEAKELPLEEAPHSVWSTENSGPAGPYGWTSEMRQHQEVLDRLSVLEKTITACCGTQYIDPDAEENLTVMVMLRKKVMELQARILALEHR